MDEADRLVAVIRQAEGINDADRDAICRRLRARGAKSLDRAEALRQRDDALRRLAAYFAGSARSRAEWVLACISRYRASSAWATEQHSIGTPTRLAGRPEAEAWRALATGLVIPRERRLRQIISQ